MFYDAIAEVIGMDGVNYGAARDTREMNALLRHALEKVTGFVMAGSTKVIAVAMTAGNADEPMHMLAQIASDGSITRFPRAVDVEMKMCKCGMDAPNHPEQLTRGEVIVCDKCNGIVAVVPK